MEKRLNLVINLFPLFLRPSGRIYQETKSEKHSERQATPKTKINERKHRFVIVCLLKQPLKHLLFLI
jgi:hypothetical protein